MMASVVILNRVPKEKLAQVLTHILEKRSASLSVTDEVFTVEELQQLVTLLQMTTHAIESVVAVATTLFVEAAVFGQIEMSVLEKQGVEPEVAATVGKVWRKKGRAVAEKLLQTLPLDRMQLLKQTQWQLQVQLGQRGLKNRTEPVSIFQMHAENRAGNTEAIDVEMNHEELFGFFQQLNAIQAELDRGDETP